MKEAEGIVEYSEFKLRYRTLWVICLIYLVLLLAINISSYFIIIPVWLLLFFLPVLSLSGAVIYDYRTKNKHYEIKKAFTIPKPQIKLHIRPLTVVLLLIIAVYYFVCFFSLVLFRGSPVIIDGRYAISDNGAYSYISYEQYVKACGAETRVISAVFMLFTYISFAYFFCKKTRRNNT